MPRARCPESIEAEKRYKAGEKLVDIARSLQVPDGTVRRWKSSQDWEGKKAGVNKKKQTERSEIKPNARKQQTRTARPPPSIDQQLAEAVEENEELTQQQRDFCRYFMRNRNATQAYLKAYGCAYTTANTNGPALLVNTRIKEELRRLREIKNAALGDLCGDDVVELHMRIAFADTTDFVEFGSRDRPVLHNGAPVEITHPKTGEKKILKQTVNEVRLKDSSLVDGQIIVEVSEGRDGAKIKLADRQKSLDFLERYFELNPMNHHRKEYDRRRLEIEEKKAEASSGAGATSTASEALVAALTEAYKTRRAANADD